MKSILTLCALAITGALALHAADGDKSKPAAPGDGVQRTPEELFKKLDANHDGVVSKEEYLASPRSKQDPAKAAERFKEIDKDGDGKITMDEFKGAVRTNRPDDAKKPAGDKK